MNDPLNRPQSTTGEDLHDAPERRSQASPAARHQQQVRQRRVRARHIQQLRRR